MSTIEIRKIGITDLDTDVIVNAANEGLWEGRYEVEVISGVTSVTAVAAKLALPLSFGDESVMITSKQYVDNVDTLVIMKAGSILKELKEIVGSTDKEIYLVENCGMPDERIYKGIASIPDEAGYFSIAIVIGRNVLHRSRE